MGYSMASSQNEVMTDVFCKTSIFLTTSLWLDLFARVLLAFLSVLCEHEICCCVELTVIMKSVIDAAGWQTMLAMTWYKNAEY